MKAIAELVGNERKTLFGIICGPSSGAINAAKPACGADNFAGSVYALEMLWSELSSSQVYRVGYRQLLKSLATLFISFFRRGINREHSLALLDNSPLAEMLGRHIDLHRLEPTIVEGHLHALCITASGYSSGDNLCFYQGDDTIEPWKSSNRCGTKCKFNYDHVLASLALPGIIPPVRINREYFGDGALRQTAPMWWHRSIRSIYLNRCVCCCE